ncbi:Polyadenylate-binding protein RBP47B' [Camellia lanceoleosa]|uniref:Polyadenylate-binding protein RBP47B n=1 Tax=Camellia lanceoleosa TaxID=1840588 RepID=A0ACC0GHV8_9ERIC|nr:Polyadenylate-binding protein RBP47B' [Camellia lanceoleosa]
MALVRTQLAKVIDSYVGHLKFEVFNGVLICWLIKFCGFGKTSQHRCSDYLLQETFRTQYPSVRGAKVVIDPNTRSKGYGFVKFLDEMERNRAMSEMNGVYCSTRPMRIGAATPKKTTTFNTICRLEVFIGNLNPNVTEEELRQIFLHFGEIIYVKIPTSRGCGFVQFTARASAEEAIQRMQGTMISQQAVQPFLGQDQQANPSQWSSTYYGYGQGYDAYGYGTTHDPSLYAYGAYPGYAQYPQQVEGSQEMASMASCHLVNAAYLALPSIGSAILGRPMWQRTSSLSHQAGSYGSTYFICRSLIGFWCANVTERKAIICKKTAVPEGNPDKFCFCTCCSASKGFSSSGCSSQQKHRKADKFYGINFEVISRLL